MQNITRAVEEAPPKFIHLGVSSLNAEISMLEEAISNLENSLLFVLLKLPDIAPKSQNKSATQGSELGNVLLSFSEKIVNVKDRLNTLTYTLDL